MARFRKRKTPALLLERRAAGRDDIRERNWSENPLGEAFTKEQLHEKTKRLKFYESMEEAGNPKQYRQHKILQGRIARFIKARPSRHLGMEIVKGQKHGYYYVKIKSISTDQPIFIRLDRPHFKEAVSFLEKGKSTGEIPEILRERRPIREMDDVTKRDWSKNRLGKVFTKEPKNLKLCRFYATQEQLGNPELYKQHKLFEKKIRYLISARPIRDSSMTILKGRFGKYYVRISSNRTDSSILIRIDEPVFKKAVKFLEKSGKA